VRVADRRCAQEELEIGKPCVLVMTVAAVAVQVAEGGALTRRRGLDLRGWLEGPGGIAG
jgi:hypothetical protein